MMAKKEKIKRMGVSICDTCGSVTVDGKYNRTRLMSMYRKPKKKKKDK